MNDTPVGRTSMFSPSLSTRVVVFTYVYTIFLFMFYPVLINGFFITFMTYYIC